MNEKTHTLRLSRIAHELRGPAGVALGAAQELARQSGEGQQFVGMMQRGLNRVLRVADRLSRASALDNDAVKFSLGALNITELVAREAQSAADLEHKASVSVTFDLPKETLIASSDADWLSFCLREVVANAIQHAKSAVRVRLAPAGNEVMLSIDDDGPGFRESPDFSFDAAPNPRRGVGLSLPICHCVMTKGHGGSFRTEASELGGARVVMTLQRGGGK